MLNEQLGTDPNELELDEETIEITEELEIPEAAGDFSDELEKETAEEDEETLDKPENFKEGENEDDEDDAPVVKATPTKLKKTKLKKGEFEETIKRVPRKGQSLKARHFSIEIIEKKGSTSVCRVTWAEEPSGLTIGETFEAEEIAFYSEYYSLM